jgi:hypothetical protein
MEDLKLIHCDDVNQYKVYYSEFVKLNQQSIIEDSQIAYRRFNFNFPTRSSTWTYRYYNIFSLTFGSLYFYKVLEQLKFAIRQHVNTDKPLWFQSWINFHNPNEVLDWHSHPDAAYSGYLSIDPKQTSTVFENYKIENSVGKLYIGLGACRHKVELIETFAGPRITLAYDVYDIDKAELMIAKYKDDVNLSFFPV